MKSKKITVEFTRTVSPKEYSPVRIGLMEEIELEEGDNRLEVRKKVHASLKKQVDTWCLEEIQEYQSQIAAQGKRRG